MNRLAIPKTTTTTAMTMIKKKKAEATKTRDRFAKDDDDGFLDHAEDGNTYVLQLQSAANSSQAGKLAEAPTLIFQRENMLLSILYRQAARSRDPQGSAGIPEDPFGDVSD